MALSIMACSGCGESGSGNPGETALRPNLLMLSLDTTRADHLGAYGHPEIETPRIDSLAEEGALFEHCAAPVPLTVPSHASLMTGTFPMVHGVRDNGQFRLPEESHTLAEVLSRNGYSTAAHVAVFVLNSPSGLAQGFDSYTDTTAMAAPDDPGSDVPLSRRNTNELRADVVADAAIETLRGLADQPFFLFVHFFDPHSPYEPPPGFREPYESTTDDDRVVDYLGEIAYVDQQVGRILDELDVLGLSDRTAVLLTADHGEAFGEHDETGHSYFVYDTTMRVPLLLRYPPAVPAGLRVSHQVRNVDVLPTLLELFDLPPPEGVQGRSLVPYLAEPGSDLGLVAYVETLAPFLDYRYSPLRGIRDGRWKYILAPTPELYDLVVDPGETENVHDREPEVVARMRATLEELIRSSQPVTDVLAQAPDQEEVARLQELGYGGGSEDLSDLAGLEPTGADPKDRIQQMSLAATALRVFHDRNYPTAERMYATLLQSDPDNTLFLGKHADCLLALGRVPEAEAQYVRLIELDADNVGALQRLARSSAARGDLPVAAGYLEQVVRIRPQDPAALLEYGRTLMQTRDLTGAIEAIESARALDPEDLAALGLQVQALILEGEFRRAVEVLDLENARRPGLQPVLLQLAWILSTCPVDEIRSGARAMDLLEEIGKSGPAVPPVLHLVAAAALAEVGRMEEAGLELERIRGSAESAPPALRAKIKLVEDHLAEGRPVRTAEPL